MKRKILACMLAVAMLASMTACSGNGSSSSTADSGKESSSSTSESSVADSDVPPCGDATHVWDAYTPFEETVTYTKGSTKPTAGENFPEGDDYTNNPYTRYCKEQINTQVELAWQTDANNYNQKVALSIASSDIPDVMIVDRKILKQLANNELIWDMTDAYEQCISPFIRGQVDTYEGEGLAQATFDGKLMGIPGTQITGQHTIMWVRKDWLDKLGLEVPKTVDQVVAVAKEFIEKDPGDNGPGKTLGITSNETVSSTYSGVDSLYSIFSAYGSHPGNWIERDGKAINGSVIPETKVALAKIAELYKDGILDKEFAIRKAEDRSALWTSGQSGIVFSPWWAGWGMSSTLANDPECEWLPVSAVTDENGKFNIVSDDPLNQALVVSKNYGHPEAIVKTLNACNDMLRGNGEAGRIAYDNLYKIDPVPGWGIMPLALQIDYRNMIGDLYGDLMNAVDKKDKSVMKYQGFANEYDTIIKDFEAPRSDAGAYGSRLARIDASMVAFDDSIVRTERLYYGTTPTMEKKQAALDKLQTEAFVKIVMGEKPIDEFDKFVDTWYKMGGQEITDEVNAEIGR